MNEVLEENQLIAQQGLYSQIREDIALNKKIIPLDGYFYLTKGGPGLGHGYIYRDIQLEESTKAWLEERLSLSEMMSRYREFDTSLHDEAWPEHYAGRFITAEGMLKEGSNVFMFLPEALGFEPSEKMPCFGFEFIDMWTHAVLEVILPCIRQVFDDESILQLYEYLRPDVEKVIYMAAVFHEVGHRITEWRVSPVKNPNIKIPQYQFDVLGELATDITMASFMKEFPEVQSFVFCERLFWLGRSGFRADQEYGRLNNDGDCWNSAYLWSKYFKYGAFDFCHKSRKLHMNFSQFPAVFSEVINEVKALGDVVSNAASSDLQESIVHEWMLERVPSKEGRFIFPKDLQEVYQSCLELPDKIQHKF